MATYTGANLAISIDDSSGSPTVITSHVQEMNGLDIEGVFEESHSFGDSWVEQLFAGLRKAGDITLKGLYNDAAGGPNAILNNPGGVGDTNPTRTLLVTWGSTKTSSVEVVIKSFKRLPARGAVTKYECVLSPSGAVTEA